MIPLVARTSPLTIDTALAPRVNTSSPLTTVVSMIGYVILALMIRAGTTTSSVTTPSSTTTTTSSFSTTSPPPPTTTVNFLPCSVVIFCPSTKEEESTSPLATWYNNSSCNVFSYFGCNKQFKTPVGKAVKAESLGANTVKGPGPLSVATNSAADKAVTNVVKIPALIAVVGISTKTFPFSSITPGFAVATSSITIGCSCTKIGLGIVCQEAPFPSCAPPIVPPPPPPGGGGGAMTVTGMF
mmetsp:Transcript_13918/g.15526  ORF Transcript_13918/g.15526 Transcript_13918/m.15526 type:complete len:241 (+) Transcript_13918:379-1101(+)